MNLIDYPGLVLGALRHAIAGVLRQVAEEGLPGEHHFYITFRTRAAGVEMPESLLRQHPDELTIVLQNQFWDLAADDAGFSVTLRFGGAPSRLRVPFEAMTAFADPSVEFGVQLAVPEVGEGPDGPVESGHEEPEGLPAEGLPAEGRPAGAANSGTVIAFDKNRKRD